MFQANTLAIRTKASAAAMIALISSTTPAMAQANTAVMAALILMIKQQ